MRLALASGKPGNDFGGGWHLGYRRAGITQEVAFGFHRFYLTGLGDHAAMFARIGINLIEWDRVGSDDGAGFAGPSFELGVGVRRHPGPCLVLSATRDLRFNDRDDTFLGASVGLCTIAPTRHMPRR